MDCTIYRAGMAGMGTYVLNLCEGLSRVARPGEVSLLVQRREAAAFAEFSPRLRIRTVPGSGVVQRLLWQNLVFPMMSGPYDAVCFPATFRPILFPKPTVVVVHDLQYLTFPEHWTPARLAYRRMLSGLTIRHASRLIAISPFTASEVLAHFGREARVVANPVIVGALADVTGQPESAGLDEPFFLVLGSLLPHKNIGALIEALRSWPTAETIPRFVFIGPFVPTELSAGLPEERVSFLGFVSRQVRDELLHRCAAVVIPSVFEGFGLPYAEAILAGKPVIASDILPARDLIGDDGHYIAAPYDAASIQATLQAVVRGPLRKPSQATIDAIRDRTDPATVGRQVLETLREAAERRAE